MKATNTVILAGCLSLVNGAPQFGDFNSFNSFSSPSSTDFSFFGSQNQPDPAFSSSSNFFSQPSSFSSGSSSFSSSSTFSSPSNSFSQPFSSSGSSSFSSSAREEEEFNGKTYLISWRIGQLGFSHGGGDSWCIGRNNKGKSYRAISIDDGAEESYFKNLVAKENQKYFWTGGNVSGRSISWPSGNRYDNVEWSHTGGARPPRPQPDNREGNEFCVGVLNNFYNDGVKFHDIACHHRKPVICEEV